jgi:predicted O-methyltransferase YrrM
LVSSVSDYPGYRDFCRLAATDPEVFANFRQHPTYCWVVSAWVPHEARDFYEILKQRGEPLDFFEALRAHERIGGPSLAVYDPIGAISPQTVRYVKVLSDLDRLFPSLAGKTIVEIGAGFGGQCAVIAKRYDFARYILVDLPEPLMLARRYLESLGIERVEYACLEDLPALGRYDLAISAYGLSEIARPTQIDYLQRVLRCSAGGYLLWNCEHMRSVRDWQLQSFGSEMIYVDEMLRLVPDSRLMDDSWLARGERELYTQLMVWGTR